MHSIGLVISRYSYPKRNGLGKMTGIYAVALIRFWAIDCIDINLVFIYCLVDCTSGVCIRTSESDFNSIIFFSFLYLICTLLKMPSL